MQWGERFLSSPLFGEGLNNFARFFYDNTLKTNKNICYSLCILIHETWEGLNTAFVYMWYYWKLTSQRDLNRAPVLTDDSEYFSPALLWDHKVWHRRTGISLVSQQLWKKLQRYSVTYLQCTVRTRLISNVTNSLLNNQPISFQWRILMKRLPMVINTNQLEKKREQVGFTWFLVFLIHHEKVNTHPFGYVNLRTFTGPR